MIDVRYFTVNILNKTFTKKGYSNIVLDNALSEEKMELRDKKFITHLYYGVIERKLTLDYIISKYSSKKVEKLDDSIVNILRTAIYQMLYMDSVPDSAVVNESVKLTKKFRVTSASSFVNAILRNFLRQDKSIELTKDNDLNMQIKYSAPKKLIEQISKDYGIEKAESFFKSSIEKPPIYIKINNCNIDEKELDDLLKDYNIEKIEKLPFCYKVMKGNIANTEAFKNGYFHIQDIASQICCMALSPQKNEIVLDVCAAPGGKTFTMAEMMCNTGKIISFDLYENKVNIIKESANKLNLKNIEAVLQDATKPYKVEGLVDKILCDVPCSGIGVIRRKPEIKYKNFDEYEGLPEIQYNILENASKYLRVGGELVYSTCTLNKNENENVIDKFLSNNKDYEPVEFLGELGYPFNSYKVSLFPEYFDSDGFFIAKIRRIR